MGTERWQRLWPYLGRQSSTTAAQWLAAILSGLYIAAFLAMLPWRLPWPLALEPVENASLQEVRRILGGQSLYVKPSLDYVPLVYPPLYFWLSAVLTHVCGEGFLPLRLVSAGSTLGCFVVVFQIVRRETDSAFAGYLSAALFAATFRVTGTFFDLARVDALCLLLMLVGTYLLRFSRGPASGVAAGLVFALAVLAKQTALGLVLPMIAYAVVTKKRASLPFVLAAVGGIAVSTLLCGWLTDGWYYYYTVHLPRLAGINRRMIGDFWSSNIAARMWFPLILIATWRIVKPRNRDERPIHFYLVFGVAMVVIAWAGRIHLGGYKNALFPAYAAIAIVSGIALQALVDHFRALKAVRDSGKVTLLFVGLSAQLATLVYNPASCVPNRQDAAIAARLIEAIRVSPGNVFVPEETELGVRAGRRSYASWWSLLEVLKDPGETRDGMVKQGVDALRNGAFAAMLSDFDDGRELLGKDWRQWYVRRTIPADAAEGAHETKPNFYSPMFLFESKRVGVSTTASRGDDDARHAAAL
jgi:4-amino-4-deoxy-L-arabinose transferase-like glycosyltransferase